MEDPLDIIQQIIVGMTDPKAEVRTEPDRRTAIEMAIEMAKPSDIVLIAGKGHETYQIIGKETFPFDDQLVAAEALAHHG